MTTGDFDGDGTTDYARLGDTGAWVFHGSTKGAFTPSFQDYEGLDFGLSAAWDIVGGDFDGDGRADYARLGDTGTFCYFGNDDQTFTPHFQDYVGLSFGAPSEWESITGDFDGDGRDDYARLGDTGAWLYYGTSNAGTFTRGFHDYEGLSFGSPSEWQTLTGDFDGDGRTDYARLGDTGSFFYFGTTSRTFTSLFHEDSRHFGVPSPFTPVVGDFTGDGEDDYARLGGVFAEVFIHD